jgi:hypothetical protein
LNQNCHLPTRLSKTVVLDGRDLGRPLATLSKVKQGAGSLVGIRNMTWFKIETAPFERDLEVAVVDFDGAHPVVFPCRRVLGGWIKATTGSPLNIHPTHWREWTTTASATYH